jgi:hypothetical protein
MPQGSYRFLPLLLVLLLASSADAATRRVPSEFPTIQAGINAAAVGDTVLVSPGTYTGDGNRDIDFDGKDVVLIGEEGPENTILNAEGTESSPHRVFEFGASAGLVTSAARIDGFTITGGRTVGSGGSNPGAGILVIGSPTISRCIIRGNWSGDGGPVEPSKAEASQRGCGFGGGIAIENYSPMRIEDCFIESNGADCEGGAVMVFHSTDLVFERCVIADNRGKGVWIAGGSCALVNCTLANSPGYSENGWDLFVGYAPGTAVRLDRTIVGTGCGGVYVNSGDSIEITCSLVDTAGIAGEGLISVSGPTVFANPLFCGSNDCSVWPIGDPGDYRVQAGSVALPENNPCGVLIGALGSCAATSVPPSFQPPEDAILASPNPFSTRTSLSLGASLDRDATLSVFDVAGRRVREFRMSPSTAPVVWDGADDNGQRVAAGVYLMRLDGRSDVSGRVMVVR